MTTDHKSIARRVFEEFFNGKFDVADEIFASNYVGHDPVPGEIRGASGMKEYARMYRTAFPDLRMSVDEQIVEGDRVITRWTAQGTHRGELMGTPPSQKRATVTGISFDRIANGKIQESWTQWDALGLMRQIGAVAQAAAGVPSTANAPNAPNPQRPQTPRG